MNYRAAAQYLSTFINHEKNLSALSFRKFDLERVRTILEAVGSPHKHLKTIHIAGSKGKGSTAAFTANILQNAGYRVGLYTSPHLYDLRERFRILSPEKKHSSSKSVFPDEIPAQKFAVLLSELKPHFEKYRRHPQYGSLTYFEVLTILAFYYFDREKVDFVVLETGLGGRLDATNVCEPLVCAITPIGLEHTAILGNTLTQIAVEKAGIIKRTSGFPVPLVISGPQTPAVAKILKDKCQLIGASLVFVGKDIQIAPLLVKGNEQKFVLRANGHKIFVVTKLLGAHQRDNAATAYGIVRFLFSVGFSISDQNIQEGISQVFWPLRFEIVRRRPVTIVDGAHTPESCAKLTETIRKIFPGKKVILILGVSDDKDIQNMVRQLSPVVEKIILTQAKHPRALVWNDSNTKFFKNASIIRNVSSACQLARKICKRNQIIVASGSIFVAAEARQAFLKG